MERVIGGFSEVGDTSIIGEVSVGQRLNCLKEARCAGCAVPRFVAFDRGGFEGFDDFSLDDLLLDCELGVSH